MAGSFRSATPPSSGSAPMRSAFCPPKASASIRRAARRDRRRMLFALGTGFVSLRTRGAYFIMITLAFGQMVYFIATSLAPYGGDNGLTIDARNTVAGCAAVRRATAPSTTSSSLCLMATYGFARVVGRIALRPRAARRQGECGPHGDDRLQRRQLQPGRLYRSPAPSADWPDFCSRIRPSSWRRPICRGSNPASCWSWSFSAASASLGRRAASAASSISSPRNGCPALIENWQVIFGPILVLVVLFARGGMIGLSACGSMVGSSR